MVVGLATPSVLGSVTVSLWSRSGVFDVSGPTRLALFLLVAVAWMAWLRIIVGLCLDVVSALRHPDDAERVGGLRGHLAGWVLGFALLVLPGPSMGAGLAGATTAAAPISAPLLATNEVASPLTPSVPISPVSPAPSADSPVVSATPVSANTLAANTVPANTVATYTVVSGDCLSTIALRFYGDEGAWNEIWAANGVRVMADGMRFGDPNLIYPGWILVLPDLPGANLRSPRQLIRHRPCRRIRRRPSLFRRPAPPRRDERSKGWEWTGGIGARGDQGQVRPDDEPGVGTAPTRAGRCQRAGRGRDTSWREQRR